jgi:lysophospholipase L1-like esterase
MKVVFLGDSIREQYAPKVTELLGEEFEVWHPNENCRFSKYTLRGLFGWANAMKGADIVHWNNGLWDICDLWGDGTFSSEEEYVANMLRILGILQKNHKKIIFATTTPVRPENRYDKNVNIDRFNQIIVPILKERGVIINDLNGLLKTDVYRYIREDCIHLSEDGIELCANQVAQYIKAAAEGLGNVKAEDGQYTEEDTLGLPVLL